MALHVDTVELQIKVTQPDANRQRLRELDDEMIKLQNEMKKMTKENQEYIDKSENLKSIQATYAANGRELKKLRSELKGLEIGTDAYNEKQAKIKEVKDGYIETFKTIRSLKVELAGMNRYTEEYLAKEAKLKAMQQEYKEVFNKIDITSMSIKELTKRQKELNLVMRQLPGDSADFKNVKEEYDALGHRIGQLKGKAKEVQTTLSVLREMPGVVGFAASSFAGLGLAFKTFISNPFVAGATAIIALVAGLWSLTKHSMEFSKALSELSAITGATGADLDYLKARAKNLASEYGKSAVEIVDAMKMVGSAKPELLDNVQALSDMTESVLTLSKASGMDLSQSAESLTTIMNQFGMSSYEANRAINVLAAGSKFGSVEVDYLGESISKVGTIAKSAGMTLEQTTSVMELFGEKGVKAETAGNGFKSILVALQKDSNNYTNGVFDLNKAIENNQSISGDNMALQKKFGTEFFNLAQILFQNKERFEQLTQQVTGTQTAEEQMAIATNNLSGDMDKMSSSWDKFLLGLEDGQGPITNTFRTLIQWTTDGINALSDLTKSSSQKQNESTGRVVQGRVKDFVSSMPKNGDRIDYINKEIIAERHIYQRRQARIAQLQSEIDLGNKLGGAWANKNKDREEEIDNLRQLVKESIAYNNALAGVRAAEKKVANKTSDDNKDKPKTTPKKIGKSSADHEKVASEKEISNAREEWNDAQAKITNAYFNKEIKSEDDYNKKLYDAEIAYLEKVESAMINHGQKHSEISNQIASKKLAHQKEEERKAKDALVKAINEQLEAIDISQSDEIAILDKQRTDNKMSEIAYNDALIEIEKKFLKQKQELKGLTPEQQKQFATETKNVDSKAEKQSAQETKNFSDKYGSEKDKLIAWKEQEQQILDDYAKKHLLSSEEKAKAQAVLDQEYNAKKLSSYENVANQISNIASNLSSAASGFQSAEITATERKYKKLIKAAGSNSKEVAKLEDQKEAEIAKIKAKWADKQFILTAAQIVASTAAAAMNAWATTKPTALAPFVVAAVVASGLANLAQANQAREDAKAGYYDGGYTTSSTDDHKPVGTVHANEFVGTAKGVRNPAVRKFYDVFNSAQMDGSIGMINTTEILKRVQLTGGFYDGGYTSPSNPQSINPSILSMSDIAHLSAVLQRNAEVMEKVHTKLGEPLQASVAITGKTGINEQQALYDRMIANTRRSG